MNKIISILMKRDGLTRDEAKQLLNDFVATYLQGDFDPFEAEEIFQSEFGLEPDFFEILMFDQVL